MATSLKAELDTWAAALKAYDEQDFENALDSFSRIADSSKILTNMGLIYATIGEHEAAVQQFMAATALDPFLAIAYFQSGVSNFLLEQYDIALQNFDDALLYLRGNQAINYEQIGLKFKLFTAEVLFNKGLSHIYLGYPTEGLAEMEDARNQKVTEEHDVIDDAIKDRGEGYTVFSIPVGVLYRPSDSKLKNSKSKDYLGKARLVAASDATDAFTEFTGVKKLKEEREKAKARDQERDDEGLRRSATTMNAGPRSTTRAFPSTADAVLGLPPTSGLSRSNTAAPVRINIPAIPSSRPPTDDAPALSPTSPLARSKSLAPSRSNTIIRPIASSGVAASRGLTIRKKEPLPGQQPEALFQPQYVPPSYPDLPQPDLLDDYIDSYAEDYLQSVVQGPLPNMGVDRVALWPQGSAQSGPEIMGNGSLNLEVPIAVNLSRAGGGSMRRKPTRRATQRRPKYEEEEEGYVSGEYDDPYELSNIRIKLHYQGDVRGMTLTPDTSFEEFVERVTSKFGTAMDGLGLKFKDEDDVKVTLRDDSDYELAIETARANAKGKGEGKLEIWCTDM
ncbi:hypothetical protein CY34DRAFT_82402 [Suillus luteus UH-Slu-Lm8-n1]|uniref:PB1 domain-containing protein n=1 Tax=Suillus luteus UH-Slu-Lm8-n1 TaxID=930992 RepID=A0A0C9ZZL7_9AGAM|nr:hypothetical protein CY34DRAFT_82402 [Suillus luteus UH-Slu-Lm8-n1]